MKMPGKVLTTMVDPIEMSDHPKPPHAVSIWIKDEILHVELPNLHGGTPHYLKLPNNVWGMTQLVNILKARKPTSKLGEKGDQTQAQAEAEMKKLAKGIDPMAVKRPHAMPLTPQLKLNIMDVVRRFVR